jgi:hypothetical protein
MVKNRMEVFLFRKALAYLHRSLQPSAKLMVEGIN